MEETHSEMSVQPASDDALAQLVTLLRERLAQALGRAVQAQAMVSGEQVDAAVGSLAGLDVELADAAALQRSIILLRQRGPQPRRQRNFV